MGDLSLRDRLRDHAEAFDGLLSLIPAKMYYGEDNSDQWKKKKQTKQEAAAARRGKLDPDSELNRNAKEVMDERAKNKRKLREIEPEEETGEEQDEDDTFEVPDGVEAERPGEGLKKKAAETTNKKQKLDGEAEEEEKEEEGANEEETGVQEPASHQGKLSKKEEKAAAKREKRKEKKAEKKSKAADAPPTPAKASAEDAPVTATPKSQTPKSKKQSKTADKKVSEAVDAQKSTADAPQTEAPKDLEDSNASAADSEPQSPTFDFNTPLDGAHDNSAEPASTTTSISSAVPPSEKPKHIKIPADTSALRARLAAKIEALRAARKADGPDGKPIRTRQELIEARRAKEAQRKEHKKELRKQARLEEERKREEALASNSPGVMSPAVELDEATGNFSFGRVAFGDGTQMSHDLSYVLTQNKKKGPSDPKTALLKVQNQKKRLQELDEEKQKDIAEKEAWLTARRRIEGEKIRDDETMLKKALKRKETAKKKSEKAWKERSQGVEQAQKARQKKREENIKKRREEKLLGKAGKKKKKGGVKKKGRPGFEGSLGVGGRKK